MGLALTLARRSLLQRPGRTLFSVLGIGLGLATVVAVRTLDHNTIEGMRLRHDRSDWRPEMELHAVRGVPDPLGELEQVEGIAGAAAFFQNEVVIRLGPEEDASSRPPSGRGARRPASDRGRPRARLIAAESGALPEMDSYRLLSGEHLDPSALEPELLIGESLASSLGLAPGDTLELSRPARAPRKECVDGVLQNVSRDTPAAPAVIRFTLKGVLAPEKLGRRAGGEVVLVDLAWGRTLFEGARIDERYWVRPDPLVDLERLQAELSTSFAYDIGRSVVIGRAADERAFRNGTLLAGLLALVLGLYVIFHTLSTTLLERIVEIGTLNALGATRAQIGRALLLEAAVLALLGGAVGLGGGVVVAWALLREGITTLGSGIRVDRFEVPWSFVLPITAIGVVLALSGAAFPLLRARGASTVDALRGERALRSSGGARGFQLFAALLLGGVLPALYFVVTPVVGEATAMRVGAILIGVGVLALLIALPFAVPRLIVPCVRAISPLLCAAFGFSGRMASYAMRSDPRRVAVASAAVALVVAALVGLKGMTRSLAGEIESWAERAVIDKVFVSDLPQVSFDALRAALHEAPEVLGVEPDAARSFPSFLMLGTRVEELSGYGPLKDDPRIALELAQGDSIVLSDRLARNRAYEVGDFVQVSVGRDVRPFRVAAITDAYGYFPQPDERMYGVVSDRVMEQDFCLDIDTVERVAVRLAPGTDPELVTALVQAFVGGESSLRFESGASLRGLHLRDIDQDFRLFDILLALTAVLAAVGVLNGLLLSGLEREGELGVLRAMGATRAQIAGMVLIEALFVGLVGGAVGALTGVALAPMIVRSLELLSGLTLPLRGAGGWIVVALLGALALSTLAALYPVWRMSHSDPVRALRAGRTG